MKTQAITAISAFLGGAAVVGATMVAQGVLARGSGPDAEYAADGRVFPYRGYLELDGAAIDETVTFGVVLSNGGSTFSEEHVDVPVYAGEFQLLIGSGSSQSEPTIPSWVYNTDGVTIEISVNGTAMSNPQAIHPVPYAHWAAEGQDFFVEGTLGVGVDATDAVVTTANRVGFGHFAEYGDYSLLLYQGGSPSTSYGMGIQSRTLGFNSHFEFDFYSGDTSGTRDATRPALELDGYRLAIGGSDLILGTNGGRDVGARALQRALVHYTSDTLVVNFAGDFEGGVEVQSDLTARDDLSVHGVGVPNPYFLAEGQDGLGRVTVRGPENNGADGALNIYNASNGTGPMRIDQDEIDSMGGDGQLYLNNNSSGDINLRSTTNVTGDLNVTGSLSGRIVGGGSVTCAANSTDRIACTSWGGGACTPGGTCYAETCPAGSTHVPIGGANQCYNGIDWSGSCHSWLCVQD